MKILILVTLIWEANVSYLTWSSDEKGWNPDGRPPASKEIVSSAEAAAIEVWKDKRDLPMFGRHEAMLYEVDLETKAIKEIPIPKVEIKP